MNNMSHPPPPLIFLGVNGSYAHVSVINGSLRGFVDIPGDTTYHIDPADQHFDQPSFHSLIYPESRMDKDPYRFDACYENTLLMN